MVDWFSVVLLVGSTVGWRLARVGCRLVATAPRTCSVVHMFWGWRGRLWGVTLLVLGKPM